MHFEFCRENIEILYVSSTNKRIISLLNYCSLLYYRFVQLFFLRPRYDYGAGVFCELKRRKEPGGTPARKGREYSSEKLN